MATMDADFRQLLAKYGVAENGEKTPAFPRDENASRSARASSNDARRRPSPIRRSESRTSEEGFRLHMSELRSLPKSPKSGAETSRPTESRAFALAMSALQDKVKTLEAENNRLLRENSKTKVLEGSVRTANELSEKMKNLEQANAKLTIELREKSTELDKLREDYEKVLGELRRAKDLIERLQQHNQLRDRRSQKNDQFQTLEVRSKRLEELNKQQSDTIDHLNRELVLLKQRSKLRHSVSRDETTLKTSLKPPLSFLAPSDTPEGLNCLTTSDGDLLSPGNSLDTSTRRLEREIEDYNKQYKALLKKSQEPGADLLSLRVELNSIAAAMEAKGNHLAAVRRQLSRDYASKI